MKQENNITIGSRIFVEQAWEDEDGNYHDEVAEVIEVNDGKMRLKFPREDVTKFLDGADFDVEDYKNCVASPSQQSDIKPNPGSNEAQEEGCLCPIVDNHYGRGAYGDGKSFWMVEGCPLHDIKPQPEQASRGENDA